MPDLRCAGGKPQQFLAPLDVSIVACTGVRGLQAVRRSRSSSRTTGGRMQNKVRAAKEYVFKSGLETEYLAAKLLGIGALETSKVVAPKALALSVVPLCKGEVSSFRKYYQEHFQPSQSMDWLYKQMTPAKPDDSASFRTYYKTNFQSNSLCVGAMGALYKSFARADDASFGVYYKTNFKAQGAMGFLYKQFESKAPAAPSIEKDTASFREYYQKNFKAQCALRDRAMQALYKQFEPKVSVPTAPEDSPSSFRTYYQQNFQGSSVHTGVMANLYKQFEPEIVEAIAPQTSAASFRDYYTKNFKAQCALRNRTMDALYKQFEPAKEVSSSVEDVSSSFRQYYQQNFQGGSLSKGAMDSLYKQFEPKVHKENASSFRDYYNQNFKAQCSLRNRAMDALYKQFQPKVESTNLTTEGMAVPSWKTLGHRLPSKTTLVIKEVVVPIESVVAIKDSPVALKPSVASNRLRLRMPPKRATTPAQPMQAATPSPKQEVKLVLKPSVGTWYAPRRS